jgi:O-antigen ligase
VKNLNKVKNSGDNSPITWLISGVAATTLYFQTNLADPFNSPKMWIIFLLSAWLSGYLVSYRRIIIKVFAVKQTVYLALFFILSALVATIFSDHVLISIFGDTQRRNGFVSYLSLAVITVAAAVFFRVSNVKRIFNMAYLVGTISVFYAILQTNGHDFVKWNNPYNSIIGTVGNPNFAAAVMAIIGVLILATLLNSDFNLYLRFFGLGIAVLLLIVIYLSDARQGLLSYILGGGIFLITYLFGKNKTIGLASLLAGIFIFIFGILGMLQVGPLEKFLYKPSVSVRGYYWRAGLAMFRDHPWLGVGMDRYGAYFKQYREVGYPLSYGYDITSSNAHNTFIQLFATGGVFLGLSYLIFNGYVMWRAIVGLRKLTGNSKMLLSGIFSAWIAFQAQSLVSIDNIGISIWGWVLGGAIIGVSVSATSIPGDERKFFNVKPSQINLGRAMTSSTLGLIAALIVALLYRGESNSFQARGSFDLQDAKTKSIFKELEIKTINTRFIDESYALAAAMYLCDGGYLDEGLAAVKKINKSDPRNLDALNALALVSENLGKFNDAIEYRLEMAKLDPWNAKNYLALGKNYKVISDTINTTAMLDKILSFAASDPIAEQAKTQLTS